MYSVYKVCRSSEKMAAVSLLTGKGFRLDVKHRFRLDVESAPMRVRGEDSSLIPEEFYFD